MSDKPWRCRFGIHQFVVVWNEDNQRYRRCSRCGADDAGSTSSELDRCVDPGGGVGG